jgi:hypothetical protein
MNKLKINDIQRTLVDTTYNVFDVDIMQKVSKCSLEDVVQSIERAQKVKVSRLFENLFEDISVFEKNTLLYGSFVTNSSW